MEKKDIIVSDELRSRCPQFRGGAVYAAFKNTAHSDQLWMRIDAYVARLREMHTVDDIKEIAGIKATREAYRACGKDPSRYRPSNEQLLRRTLQGKELYAVDTAVDLINLCSMTYAYSIGGFDYDKIEGDRITLGVGRAGEPYEGIGRGTLNIEGMPVYRDAVGGFGTPTSDNERTKMGLRTTRLLALVNGYDGNVENVRGCCGMIRTLLEDYLGGHDIEIVEF